MDLEVEEYCPCDFLSIGVFHVILRNQNWSDAEQDAFENTTGFAKYFSTYCVIAPTFNLFAFMHYVAVVG